MVCGVVSHSLRSTGEFRRVTLRAQSNILAFCMLPSSSPALISNLRIVAPDFRISTLDRQARQFVQCLFLVFRLIQAMRSSRRSMPDEFARPCRQFAPLSGEKITRHVDPSDRVPHLGVDKPHSALPSFCGTSDSGESAFVKVKMGSDEAPRKIGGGRIDEVKCLPGL